MTPSEAAVAKTAATQADRPPRDMYEPDMHIETLKVKARNFR